MIILGAGLSGLIAGCMFQGSKILEAGPEWHVSHRALLRFRTSAVGDAVGIQFRQVRVHKGIWSEGRFVQPDILMANLYSRKVVGRLADRSIWNISACDRFVAPEEFPEMMMDRCRGRIEFNCPVTELSSLGGSAISTIPLPAMAKMTMAEDAPEMKGADITVRRWAVSGADCFQTVYFPDSDTRLYRASITGNVLIAEYIGDPDDSDYFMDAFGVKGKDLSSLPQSSQKYGKISPINEKWRREFIFNLTHLHGIYSLGRFATWRNILLDDVLKDISVIKRLAGSGAYERALAK